MAALSPYLSQHINRFGRYHLDLTQPPPPLNYDLQIVTRRSQKRTLPTLLTGRGSVIASSPSGANKTARPKRNKKGLARQLTLL